MTLLFDFSPIGITVLDFFFLKRIVSFHLSYDSWKRARKCSFLLSESSILVMKMSKKMLTFLLSESSILILVMTRKCSFYFANRVIDFDLSYENGQENTHKKTQLNQLSLYITRFQDMIDVYHSIDSSRQWILNCMCRISVTSMIYKCDLTASLGLYENFCSLARTLSFFFVSKVSPNLDKNYIFRKLKTNYCSNDEVTTESFFLIIYTFIE